jgi:hypothetical protein
MELLNPSWLNSTFDNFFVNFTAGTHFILNGCAECRRLISPSALNLTSLSISASPLLHTIAIPLGQLTSLRLEQLPSLTTLSSIITSVNTSIVLHDTGLTDFTLESSKWCILSIHNAPSLKHITVLGPSILDVSLIDLPVLVSVTWPSLHSMGTIDIVRVSISLFSLPMTVQTIRNFRAGSSSMTLINFGGVHTIDDKVEIRKCDQLNIIDATRLGLIYGDFLINNNELLSTINVAPLAVLGDVRLEQNNRLSLTGFKLRTTSNLIVDGNVTDILAFSTLQCASSRITLSTCCPDVCHSPFPHLFDH